MNQKKKIDPFETIHQRTHPIYSNRQCEAARPASLVAIVGRLVSVAMFAERTKRVCELSGVRRAGFSGSYVVDSRHPLS